MPAASALGDHFFSRTDAPAGPYTSFPLRALGLPKGLDVDDDALDEGLRVLQRLHPTAATSTQEQRDLADAASARVNGATAVLRDDAAGGLSAAARDRDVRFR